MCRNRFLHKLLLYIFCVFLFSCGSENHNDLGLNENEIAYFLANSASYTYGTKSSLTKEGDSYKLSILGIQGSEGIIITVSNVKAYTTGQYLFYKDVSVIVNDKSEENLIVYVSSACKQNQGVFEIVDWNKEDKTISGRLSGPICTRGIFGHLPGTYIDEAAFFKIKYSEQ